MYCLISCLLVLVVCLFFDLFCLVCCLFCFEIVLLWVSDFGGYVYVFVINLTLLFGLFCLV